MIADSDRVRQRNETLAEITRVLPGSVPYDNVRPINVPARMEGQTLWDCLRQMHPHIAVEQWEQWFDQGHIRKGIFPVRRGVRVRGGDQFQHLFPNTVEPDVDGGIRVLWEDDALVVLAKPAPLPVHSCGRFHLNTLMRLMIQVYPGGPPKLVHRLDANTTGVMVMARDRASATHLRRQFEENRIDKCYLARCLGQPREPEFVCTAPIAKQRGSAGVRGVDAKGQPACTAFRVLSRGDEPTTLLEAQPRSGRTNQIRIHLWGLGMPVLGDPAYLPHGQLAATQTLCIDDPPMCLHASKISLVHPLHEQRIEFVAPDPGWAKDQACP